ncbi:hypothetical protein EI94DRAFT_1707102 [Lactarius quietus]|nr:hypothetical protein EI94DRAFT_1707102 [Lactarius quietus]
MDNHRPGLDLKFYDKICPDLNVPIIAVFTKYDQFRRNVKMDVSDYLDNYPDMKGFNGNQVVEKLFQDHYLRPLGNDARYVRLEKMHMKGSRCDGLVEATAAALNKDTVTLMLLAVRRGNIELSVKMALNRFLLMTAMLDTSEFSNLMMPVLDSPDDDDETGSLLSSILLMTPILASPVLQCDALAGITVQLLMPGSSGVVADEAWPSCRTCVLSLESSGLSSLPFATTKECLCLSTSSYLVLGKHL